MYPEYMNYKEAMNYLGISNYRTINDLIGHGLPVIKIGNSKRISKAAIDKFMADHTVITGQDTKASK